MSNQKTTQLNLRMSPRAKALLQAAAGREHRSVSNMIEYLVLKYCETYGLDVQFDASFNQKISEKEDE